MLNLKLGLIAVLSFALVAAEERLFAEYAVKKFDILTLSQSWPQTTCWDLNKKWSSSTAANCSPCKMPKDKASFTLHGLWPSSLNGKHPFDCDDANKYNPNLISSSLRTQMLEKWPTFNLKTSNDVFWSHEWKKHGTCASELESTNTQPKYFSKAVSLLNQFNVGKVLLKSGIIPGKSYPFDDVVRVISKSLGVNIYLKCAVNTVTNEEYLNEVSVCFDKSFQLTNCGKTNKSNCKKKKQLVYPENLNAC